MSNKNAILIGCLMLFLIIICISCLAAIGGVSFLVIRSAETSVPAYPTPTPALFRPDDQLPGGEGGTGLGQQTLAALENAYVPENDPRELAERLLGLRDIPELVFDFNAPYNTGDQKTFWVINSDTNSSNEVPTTLRYYTDHAYFWVGNDVNFSQVELESLAETFENEIYPTNHAFFGTEWTPGVDGDPHIYVVYVRGLGRTVAGYFSPGDEYHPLASEYSNGHEMFLINAENTELSSSFARGVLAHEFQHMIHWYLDKNETSWINEGFSELAVLLNGFEVDGPDSIFIGNPDDQLNDWPNDGNTFPNYGSAFLFMTYFLDRMGDDLTKAVLGHPENGMKSIDLVLSEYGVLDPITESPLMADDLVLDWGVTNYLHDRKAMDGRYFYNSYPDAPQAFETETMSSCEGSQGLREVEQYGTDYIRITCPGKHQLNFIGSLRTGVLPEGPHEGNYAFWSNKGDSSDMSLTRQFDLSEVEGPIKLTYWMWYDLEVDYDYVYLLVSANGGPWEFIKTPSGTDYDPVGNNYGWGFNGLTETWIKETVDLSGYAGQEIEIRFEYITDAAVNGEGFLLDEISIPEIGYYEDFEGGDGGWQAAGFVRISNQLPQTYNLALISYGDEVQVDTIELAADNITTIEFEIGSGVSEVVLVVQGTTRFTRQTAAYKLVFLP